MFGALVGTAASIRAVQMIDAGAAATAVGHLCVGYPRDSPCEPRLELVVIRPRSYKGVKSIGHFLIPERGCSPKRLSAGARADSVRRHVYITQPASFPRPRPFSHVDRRAFDSSRRSCGGQTRDGGPSYRRGKACSGTRARCR